MTTVALVPAYRRADRVGDTVAGLLPLVDRVVVIDDGSDDGGATVEAARKAGATVVVLPANRGKGGALAAGIAATPDATTYLLVDADTAGTAAATAPLLAAVQEGADLAIGVLPPAGGSGGFGKVRDMARWGIRRACGFEARAPLSGQRAVVAPLLRALEPADRFGVEAGMTIDAVRAGARVVELPVGVDHAHTGRAVAGFSHRAAQGWDLVRALWPRLLDERARRRLLVGAALIVVAVLTLSAVAAVPSGAPLGGADRVVLVAAPPGLRLEDLDDPSRPELASLAGQRGAVAAANVEVPDRSAESTWATVGAGARLRAEPPTREPDPTQPFLVQDLREGQGRLGGALRQAGFATAFVGSSPTSPVRLAVADRAGRIDRAATAGSLGVAGLVNRTRADLTAGADLVAVDATGLDPAGLDALLAGLRPVGGDRRLLLVVTPAQEEGTFGLRPLLVSGPGAPAGRLVSPSTRRDGLVVLSDVAPTILDSLGVPQPDDMAGRPLRRLARSPDLPGLVGADRLARQRNTVWDPALLAVIPLHFASYAWAWRRRRRVDEDEPPVPEPDIGAWAGSRRSTEPDRTDAGARMGPARVVLTPVGVGEASDAVAGGERTDADSRADTVQVGGTGPVRDAGGATGVDDNVGTLGPANPMDPVHPVDEVEPVSASAGDAPGWPLVPLALAGADACPSAEVVGPMSGTGRDEQHMDRPGSRPLAHLGLGLVAWPLATWIVRAIPGSGAMGRWAGLLALAVDLLIVAVAWRAGRRRGLAPLAMVLGATIALITVDLGLGGALQVSSAFGHAAHTSGRFTGLGNTAFAVSAACALMAVGCARHRAPWMVALFVLVALVDALPPLGADVGGAVVLVPALALTCAALWRRLSWPIVALAAITTAVVLVVAVAVDLSRPADARTHLGRFVSGEGGGSSIGGKISQNLGVYASIPLLALVVAIAAGFALLLWRGEFRHALPPMSPARIAVAAALAVALAGNLLNDSGPIVTLLAMSIIAPSLVVRSAVAEPHPRVLGPLAPSPTTP